MTQTADRFTPVRALGPHMLLVQDQDGAPVVLKRPPATLGLNPIIRHDFRLEAWRVSRFSGPHLARLYADGSDVGDRPFYTMSYAEGPPATLVQPADVAGVVRQLLEALTVLHGQGWVHANLNPTHLRRGEGGLVLVGYGNLTSIGQRALRAGAPGFQAPEQVAGLPLDGRADLYGVGALIHYWLTGEAPGELDMLDLVADPLAVLGRRLLAVDPSDRPSSAAAALALLTGLVHAPLPPMAMLGAATPFAGRPPVLVPPVHVKPGAHTVFLRQLEDLSAGRGSGCRLEASAGAGKCTWLTEAERLAQTAGWPVLRLSAAGQEAWPLAPWRAALEPLLNLANERAPGLAERFRLRLPPVLAAPPPVRPEKGDEPIQQPDGGGAQAESLTLPWPSLALGGGLGGEIQQRRLLTVLADLFGAIAPPGLVVLVTGWQSADEASRQLLDALWGRLGDAPIAWVMASEVDGGSDATGASSGAVDLPSLGPVRFDIVTATWPVVAPMPLSREEVAALACSILPHPLTPDGAQALAAHALGSPFYVRTLLAHWRDTDAWRSANGVYLPPPVATWPNTIAALAVQVASGLEADAWASGSMLALLPEPVSPGLIDALTWPPGGGLTPDASPWVPHGIDPRAGLDGLLRAGLLLREPVGYRFAHPAIRGLFERAAPPARNRDLHRAFVALALTGTIPAAPLATALHAIRGDRPEVFAPLAIFAARRIVQMGATRTATRLLEEGLVMLDAEHPLRGAYLATLGEAQRQLGNGEDALFSLREARKYPMPAVARLDAALSLAQVLADAGDHAAACTAWREAAGHAQGVGDGDALAMALAGVCVQLFAQGAVDDALVGGEAALEAATEAGPLPRALALTALGRVLATRFRERAAEGIALLQQAAALFEAEGDQSRLLAVWLALSEAEWARGEILFARSAAERALRLAEGLGQAADVTAAGLLVAATDLAGGEVDAAVASLRAARDHAERQADPLLRAEVMAQLGLATARQGDVEAGTRLGTEALRLLTAAANQASVGRVWLAQAEILLEAALFPEAANALHVAITPLAESGLFHLAAQRTYLLGLWAARTGDRGRARSEFRAVLANPNQLLVAWAAFRLGELAAEAGARAEAAGWLEQARRGALSLGARGLARQAEHAEKALQAAEVQAAQTPAAAQSRLGELFDEINALLPRVTAPVAEVAALQAQLTEAQAINALWPRLFEAASATEGAIALATACLAAFPAASRVLVLDPTLTPWTAQTRDAGEIPFSPEQVDATAAGLAMASREPTVLENTLALPLADGAAAPVWGVALVFGEGLAVTSGAWALGHAGAIAMSRLDL